VELSLEIPTSHCKEFLPLCDFPFGLAQLFLDTPGRDTTLREYRETHYECLLDNGMYELGESLTIDEILEATTRCRPIAVIAPDWMDDALRSYEAAVSLKTERNMGVSPIRSYVGWTVGAVVQGLDLEERIKCFQMMQDEGFSPICFPFRTPRGETIGHLMARGMLKEGEWYHLLGLQDLLELRWQFPGRWSIDTGKPFKGFPLDKTASIRGHGKLKLHVPLNTDDRRIACYNIAYMRKIMQGGMP